jgi:uncharacterized membrane protein
VRKLWFMVVVAVAVDAVLVYPYLGLDSADSRIDFTGGRYAVLVVHIFTAAVALVLGPLQFLPRIRAHRSVHRAIGRTYLLGGVLPSAIATVPVAAWSGNLLTQIGLTTAAVLWLVTGALAYRAARRRDFTRHRDWMMRNYALTFLAVTARALVPLMLLTGFALGDSAPVADRVSSAIPIGQTLAWIINLAIVEVLIRRSPVRVRESES